MNEIKKQDERPIAFTVTRADFAEMKGDYPLLGRKPHSLVIRAAICRVSDGEPIGGVIIEFTGAAIPKTKAATIPELQSETAALVGSLLGQADSQGALLVRMSGDVPELVPSDEAIRYGGEAIRHGAVESNSVLVDHAIVDGRNGCRSGLEMMAEKRSQQIDEVDGGGD